MPQAAPSGGLRLASLWPWAGIAVAGAGICCGLRLAVRVILGELAKGNKEIKKVDARSRFSGKEGGEEKQR